MLFDLTWFDKYGTFDETHTCRIFCFYSYFVHAIRNGWEANQNHFLLSSIIIRCTIFRMAKTFASLRHAKWSTYAADEFQIWISWAHVPNDFYGKSNAKLMFYVCIGSYPQFFQSGVIYPSFLFFETSGVFRGRCREIGGGGLSKRQNL